MSFIWKENHIIFTFYDSQNHFSGEACGEQAGQKSQGMGPETQKGHLLQTLHGPLFHATSTHYWHSFIQTTSSPLAPAHDLGRFCSRSSLGLDPEKPEFSWLLTTGNTDVDLTPLELLLCRPRVGWNPDLTSPRRTSAPKQQQGLRAH